MLLMPVAGVAAETVQWPMGRKGYVAADAAAALDFVFAAGDEGDGFEVGVKWIARLA